MNPDALQIVLGYLKKVPFLETQLLDPATENAGQEALDALLHLRLPTGDIRAAVQVLPRGEIGHVRQAARELKTWSNRLVQAQSPTFQARFAWPYGIIIAPYLSQPAAQLCQELGIGYCDLAGNCHLSFGQVYILREKWPDPNKRRRTASLWAPKSQRVLRVLLANPSHYWKTETLSKQADISGGLVSNVRRELAEREWIEETKAGFRLNEPAVVLREWAQNYKIDKEKVHSFYSLDAVPEIEARFAGHFEQQAALTGYAGAARQAFYAKYSEVTAYVSGDINHFARALNLRRVDSGANVRLIEPYDEGVFYGSSVHDDIAVVSPLQLYLDLCAAGGRGNDAAEHLLETVLKPGWEEATYE